MTVKETELVIMESIRSIAKDQYPVCCGIIPLVRKNGIGITLKNIASGNPHSNECTLTITVKSENATPCSPSPTLSEQISSCPPPMASSSKFPGRISLSKE